MMYFIQSLIFLNNDLTTAIFPWALLLNRVLDSRFERTGKLLRQILCLRKPLNLRLFDSFTTCIWGGFSGFLLFYFINFYKNSVRQSFLKFRLCSSLAGWANPHGALFFGLIGLLCKSYFEFYRSLRFIWVVSWSIIRTFLTYFNPRTWRARLLILMFRNRNFGYLAWFYNRPRILRLFRNG